jgi:hypothetical protein
VIDRLIPLWIDKQEIEQISSDQLHHLLLYDALGLDPSWDKVSSAHTNGRHMQTL